MLNPANFRQRRPLDAPVKVTRKACDPVAIEFTRSAITNGPKTAWPGRRKMVGNGLLLLILSLAVLAGCSAQKAKSEAEQEVARAADSSSQTAKNLSQQPPVPTSPADSRTGTDSGGAPQAGQPAAKPEAIPPSTQSAREILEAMVKVYQSASSYGDQGRIVIRGTYNGQPVESRVNYLTAFERPNKLRLIAGDGVIICDGKDFWGYVAFLPGQVLKVPSPEKFDLKTLFTDTILANALMQGPGQLYSLLPPPLVLLVAEDPLKTLLYRSEKQEVIPPGTTGTFTCDRVRIHRKDGDVILWIDRDTRLLVRVDLPAEGLRQSFDGGRFQNLAIYEEFIDPVVNKPINPEAFVFSVPSDARIVSELHPYGYDYLGTRPADFEFEDTNGQKVTLASLAGKPVVLEFWSRNHPGSQAVLQAIQAVAQQFSGRVAFYAVSVDHVVDALDSPAVKNEELLKLLQSWQVTLPLLRDPRNDSEKIFGATFRQNKVTVPCLVILNAEGVVQTYHLGMTIDLVDRLSGTLEKLLSGVNLVQEEQAGFEKMKKELARLVDEASQHGLFTFALDEITAASTVEPAPASTPQHLKLVDLFKCTLIKAPGNLLVVPDSAGNDRVICVEEGNTAAEIGWDGTVKSRWPLKPLPPDKIDFLRSGVDNTGKRYFVGWSFGSQQLSIYNDQFELLGRYPGEGTPPHEGMADVRLVDLNADGNLEAVIGFLGVVGVQAISLDGKRLWSNRTAAVAFRIGVLPGAQGQPPSFLVTNTSRGSAVQISHDGQRLGEIIVPGRTIAWLAAADLDGDGTAELCGLDPKDFAQTEAFGFNLAGDELWKYTLPKGMVQYPVEQIVHGRVVPGNTEQWILVGADGSLHILDKAGQFVDRFNVGELITGVAVAQHEGVPVLVVATPRQVIAWSVAQGGP
ncbi:MAG: redoxin domain-containing protein [Thermogutta sp.]